MELPLALPAIMAGIRIATVTTISLATVAAFIGVGGLGEPIFNAIQSGFKTQFLAAGILAIPLALVADVLLVLAQRAARPWTARAEVDGAEIGASTTSSSVPFFGDTGLIWDKTVASTLSFVGLDRRGALISVPLGGLARAPPQGLVPRDQRVNIGRALPSLAVISIGSGSSASASRTCSWRS